MSKPKAVLIGCPWCKQTPKLKPVYYEDSRCLRGYEIVCTTCGFSVFRMPDEWMMHRKTMVMNAARRALITWWNSRK